MRHSLVLASLLLPLASCYPPPEPPVGYAQPGYPPPSPDYGYAQPGYPAAGYSPGPYDPDGNVYPGYGYNGGTPTLLVDGAVTPLVVFGGGWGYWDSHHNWHHAPDAVSHHLQEQRAVGGFHSGGGNVAQPLPGHGPPPGGGFHSGGPGFGQPRVEGPPPPPGAPNHGPTFFHPNEPPRPAAMPAATPPRALPPAAPPGAPPPAAPQRAFVPRPEPVPQGHSIVCPPGQRC